MLLALALAAAQPSIDGLRELREVDRIVDARVTYVAEKPGLDDWQIAHRHGDCEDHALAKKKMLVDRGWDGWDLRILFIYSKSAGGHAVLYSTSHDAVLDNNDKLTHPQGWARPILSFYRSEPGDWVPVCFIRDVSPGNKPASDRC